MRPFLFILPILVFTGCRNETKAPETVTYQAALRGIKNNDLSLSIIPFSYSQKMGLETSASDPAKKDTAYITLYSADSHFNVLLTNNSNKPINIWQEWNSWGYFGLSFEITYPDGAKEISEKQSRGWFKNFPSFKTIAPGGYHVFEVNFDADSTKWNNYWSHSVLKRPSPVSCKMKAIYEIKEGPESKEHNAWTGRIESPVSDYIIWH